MDAVRLAEHWIDRLTLMGRDAHAIRQFQIVHFQLHIGVTPKFMPSPQAEGARELSPKQAQSPEAQFHVVKFMQLAIVDHPDGKLAYR
jgi:hypothetical protein